MSSTRFIKDYGLSSRMWLAIFLNGALYVVLILAIWFIFGQTTGGVVIALLISGVAFFFQWYSSDAIAMRAMGAREVTPEQAPELHMLVDRLCQLADMKKPRVAIAYSEIPNAFATGRSPNHSVVCVTSGLLKQLNQEEVEAVLAHELSHVAHRDVTVMTVAGVTGVVAGLMMRSAMYSGMAGGNRNNNGAIVLLAMTLVGVVVYALSFLLIRVLSRYRELAADRAAAYLTGKPSTLSSALVKISGEISRIPSKDLRQAATVNHLNLVPALDGKSISALFSTHPPLQKRLDQLSRISADLSRPA